MESPVMILYILAAIAGLVALEMRRGRSSVIAIGAAFAFFAIAMFLKGAVEVGAGAIVAGVVIVVVLNWAFKRTVDHDALPALPSGGTGVLAVVALVALAAAIFLAAGTLLGGASAAGTDTHGGVQWGLLREVVVILAALAAVWAMVRKSGRRDE
jgi:hypothetical protein